VRTPLAIIAVLLAILVPIGFATDGDGGDDAPAKRATTPIATIAERVEKLRGLEFRRTPEPLRVSPAQARREGLADLDRGYPVARRRADEALFETLGLLPQGTDLREVQGSVFGEQVAGYYDPRSGRLRIVDNAGGTNPVLDEVTIAHELTHALEDQRLALDTDRAESGGDGALAYTALVEGTATGVMFEYLKRYFSSEDALGGLLGSAFSGDATGGNLPPFVLAGLLFPYQQGQRFVDDLYRRAGGWTLIDLALKDRPPLSTEQILHPRKWLEVEVPDRVAVPPAPPGGGWKRIGSGVFGEWQTGELLKLGGSARPEAAAGWGGDRYAVWQRGDETAVTIDWRWDTRRDAVEFLPALRDAVADLPDAEVSGRGRSTMLTVRR
jgi:hypothetical protein